MTRKDTNVIGRREELSLLRELIAPPHKESHVLLLLGDPGLGKTVLLAEAAREAKAAGMRVLATTGRESEQDLAFAGLHQLLRPVLDRVACLPTRQAEALRGAFGFSDDPAPPDALLTGIAVLTLLSELSDEQPLLVTADDTQWLDRASLDALAFAARRLESEQLVLLAGARGNVPPAGFERDLPQLLLRPLTRPDAGLLLDAQPRPPHGRLREQVLTQAVGNPLALIELSRVIATDPDAGRRWTAEPLPLTGQLTALMAAQYATLPPAARSALLLAAAADSPDPTTAIPGLSADALAPAEAAGLIRLDTPGPRFAHPLTRSAVYHAAPFAERAAAHRQVADALRDQPDRRAWHLAAAALEPDEHLAALLVDSAAQAQRRGGAAAAARALERAAELSPGEPDKARRLLAAAELALPAGQADWVRELAGKVLTLTSDPDLRIAARLDIGWSLLWSNRNADAFDTLLSVAAEASPRLPAIAWQATWMAATVAHQTGLPEVCAKARAALDLLDSRDGPPPTAEDWPAGRADEYRIWIRACTDPFGERADIVPACGAQREDRSRTRVRSARRPGSWTKPNWRSGCCAKPSADCAPRASAAPAAACCRHWNGHASTAGAGTTHSPPPERRATSPPPTRWKPSRARPTSPRPSWRPCAANTTRWHRCWPVYAPPWTPPNTAGSPPGSGRRQVSPRWPRATT